MVWALLVVACICDLKTYKIPNQLICLGIINAYMYAFIEKGKLGLLEVTIQMVVTCLLLYLLFLIGALGAGDVKLISLAATVVGMQNVTRIVVISLFLAAVAAIARCIKERKWDNRPLHFSLYILAAYAKCMML